MKWTTVGVYGDMLGARRAERKLEDEGVACRVLEDSVNRETVGQYWSSPASSGGHRVQVDEADLKQAASILRVPLETLLTAPEDEVPPGDAPAANAMWVALIGLIVCPGFSHAYVLWTLLTHSRDRVSAKGARRRKIALGASLVAFAALAFAAATRDVRTYDNGIPPLPPPPRARHGLP